MLHQDSANGCTCREVHVLEKWTSVVPWKSTHKNNSPINVLRPFPALCQATVTACRYLSLFITLMDRGTTRHQGSFTLDWQDLIGSTKNQNKSSTNVGFDESIKVSVLQNNKLFANCKMSVTYKIKHRLFIMKQLNWSFLLSWLTDLPVLPAQK